MRLESIAVVLRRRSPWEAVDLGRVMLRSWARQAYLAWLVTYWPAGLAVLLLLWSSPGYAMLVIWWLKPVFDRLLLHVFSRAVFGEECGVRDVLRALPRLLRSPGVLSGLTLRRLSLARSLLLPVWQLEEQRGAAARARFTLLARRCRGHAVWLTFFCANMSTILMFALLIALLALKPEQGSSLSIWEWFAEERSGLQRVFGHLLFMLAETIVEPLYVASGFALYLNRRSELEGWDIEIVLRGMAPRRTNNWTGCAVLALSGAVLIGWPSVSLHAAAETDPALACAPADSCTAAAADSSRKPRDGPGEVGPARGEPGSARAVIDGVLEDPVFGRASQGWSWRWRDPGTPSDESLPVWLNWIGEAVESLAELLRVLVWVASGLGVALAIRFLYGRRRRLGAGRVHTPSEPVTGPDDRGDALPADVPEAARFALASGRAVEAVSLLYRGALMSLIVERQIDFAAGDTEADCLGRVTGRLPEAVQRFFEALVSCWRLAAYGPLAPSMAEVDRLIVDWAVHFGRRGAS
ncbi:hypothetical protein [Accumulibacter sp.]|uniref:hypothetical protein n=1 Tax=Accumulibacter sp. TaxID=2053492 RepID=UPI0025DE6F07|nr:hypothetical protein [Accumulibacter sp.]MCM8625178.1 hypothetical protein [Accumulibacter sp.]